MKEIPFKKGVFKRDFKTAFYLKDDGKYVHCLFNMQNLYGVTDDILKAIQFDSIDEVMACIKFLINSYGWKSQFQIETVLIDTFITITDLVEYNE